MTSFLSILRYATPFFIILALNILLYLFSYYSGFERPFFNLDLFVCIAFIYSAILVPIIILFTTVDFFSTLAKIYHFHSLFDFALEINNLLYLDWEFLIIQSSIFILIIIFLSLLLQRFIFLNFYRPLYIILFVALLTLDIAGGTNFISNKFFQTDRTLLINLGTSPAFDTTKKIFDRVSSVEAGTTIKITKENTLQGKFDIYQWMINHDDKSVVLIIFESMGSSSDHNFNNLLKPDILNLNYNHSLVYSPFSGSTISAELRTLCLLSAPISSISDSQFSECLPNKLKSINVISDAYHGYYSGMFSRLIWWPKLGFSNVYFQNYGGLKLPLCGHVFRGFCDLDLIKYALNDTQKKTRVFSYILTLNSHLPISGLPEIESNSFKLLCTKHGISDDSCVLFNYYKLIINNTIQYANSLENKPLIIIMGDHSPPFASMSNSRNYDRDIVPIHIFQPIN